MSVIDLPPSLPETIENDDDDDDFLPPPPEEHSEQFINKINNQLKLNSFMMNHINKKRNIMLHIRQQDEEQWYHEAYSNNKKERRG